MRFAFPIMLLALLIHFAMADTGPHPIYWRQVFAYPTFDGAPVPDSTSINAFCYAGGNTSAVVTAPFACLNGTCMNTGAYDLYPCLNGEMSFNITLASPSRNYVTEPVRLGGAVLYFDILLKSDGTSAVNISERRNPPPNPPSSCLGAILLPAILFSAAMLWRW